MLNINLKRSPNYYACGLGVRLRCKKGTLVLVTSNGYILLQGFQTSLERGGNNIALPVTDVIGGELDA